MQNDFISPLSRLFGEIEALILLRHKSRQTVAIINSKKWGVNNELGHKPGHDVQVKRKRDIINEELGQRTYDNLPDIAGYDILRGSNELRDRVINKDRFTV